LRKPANTVTICCAHENLYIQFIALFILTGILMAYKLDAPVSPVKGDIIAIKGYHAPKLMRLILQGTDPDTTGTGTDPNDPEQIH